MTDPAYRPRPVEARVATRDELDELTETLTLAFREDPVWSWGFSVQDRGLGGMRVAWRLFLSSALEHGWVWRTEDGSAAALWVPPGKPDLLAEDEERFEPLMREALGADAERLLEAFERFEQARPSEPHYYLSLLGTHPDRTGQGWGMGLLADNLARTDAAGVAAYLESSNPANVPRYERLGFTVFDEFAVGEGIVVAQMWRDPAGGDSR
ncbi:MAG TPA: GNAT family N-acetyltransferase [Solirubrobacterales bacterium]|nr:GNAT family N-acetyltransferase [Solirubrobacterales bacterium]